MQTQPDWSRAACSGMDTEIFFPHRSASGDQAKSVCVQCPIRLDCLAHALETRQQGVWGGKTENERDDILGINRPSESSSLFDLDEVDG